MSTVGYQVPSNSSKGEYPGDSNDVHVSSTAIVNHSMPAKPPPIRKSDDRHSAYVKRKMNLTMEKKNSMNLEKAHALKIRDEIRRSFADR